MLPTGARHVRVSVRQAMAHCFGPSACGAMDPTAAEKPVYPFDKYWWDIGTTYLDHARNSLGSWLVDDRRSLQVRLVPYYQWRRDEDDAARIGHSPSPAGPQLLAASSGRNLAGLFSAVTDGP